MTNKGILTLTVATGDEEAKIILTSQKAAIDIRNQINTYVNWEAKLEFVKIIA